MAGKRIREEIVAECFRDQERAFDEWIISRQIEIIPQERPLQAGKPNSSAHYDEQEAS